MALIVEDGTIVENADSYVTRDFASSYMRNYGNTSWADLDPSVQEVAIRKATQYIDLKYQSRWRGTVVDSAQTLSWPRADVYMNGVLLGQVIPTNIKKAVCEAAFKSLTTDLFKDAEMGGRVDADITGPIKTTYQSGTSVKNIFEVIDALVTPFTTSVINAKLVRT